MINTKSFPGKKLTPNEVMRKTKKNSPEGDFIF